VSWLVFVCHEQISDQHITISYKYDQHISNMLIHKGPFPIGCLINRGFEETPLTTGK
jgi:hypothetical protein